MTTIYKLGPEELKPKKPKKLSELLAEEADRERQRAKRLKGCSFIGQWPGKYHLDKAVLLAQAALIASKNGE